MGVFLTQVKKRLIYVRFWLKELSGGSECYYLCTVKKTKTYQDNKKKRLNYRQIISG